jgi:hypothetical protein
MEFLLELVRDGISADADGALAVLELHRRIARNSRGS